MVTLQPQSGDYKYVCHYALTLKSDFVLKVLNNLPRLAQHSINKLYHLLKIFAFQQESKIINFRYFTFLS